MNSAFKTAARAPRRLAALGRRFSRQLGRALALRPRAWPRRRRAGAHDAHLAWIDSLECEANAMTPAPPPARAAGRRSRR